MGSTVVVTYPNGDPKEVVVGDNGTWSTPNPGLTDGDKVSVVATDPAGNESAPVTETVDAVAPTLNIITDNDTILTLDETADVIFTFSEAVEGFAEGNISVAGGSLSDFTIKDNVTWTATFTKDGTNTAPSISVANGSYTDLVGNEGTGDTQTWTADVVPPTGTVTDVVIYLDTQNAAGDEVVGGDGYLNNAEIGTATTTNVTVTLDRTSQGDIVTLYDAAGTVLVSHELSTAEATATSYTFNEAVTLPTTEGEALTVKAAISGDAAGNSVSVDQAAIESDTAIIDTMPPANTPTVDSNTTTPEFDVLYTTEATPTITGKAVLDAGETFQVTVGGATYNVTPAADNTWSLDTGTATLTSGSLQLTSGANSVEAKIVDSAGNASTEVTSDEVVVLAKVTSIAVEDDLTDLVDTDGDTVPEELDADTNPPGNESIIDSIKSDSYSNTDQPGYQYEGTVADQSGATSELYGLTNDNIPTITIGLDKTLATDYQDINILRYYQRNNGEWVLDDNVNEGGVANGIAAIMTDLVVSSSGPSEYSFDDVLPDADDDKNYRYEAKIVNNALVTDSTLETSQVTEFELDTVAQTPIITGYANGFISGISTEQGTVYGSKVGESGRTFGIIKPDGTWEIELSPEQISVFEGNNDKSNGSGATDDPISLGFVDKAGNIPNAPLNFYYFNDENGGTNNFNQQDLPKGGSNADTDPTNNLIDDNGVETYTTNFTSGSDIIFVKGNITKQRGDLFVIDTGAGDDSLSLENGNVFANVSIQLGEGNNTFTKTGPGKLDYVLISAGDGNDLVDLRNANAEVKYTSVLLGKGNNTIHSHDDILDTTVTTGSGNDYIHLEASPDSPGDDGIDISGKFYLGAGDDKIELEVGGINTWGTNNTTKSTHIDMGAGNDVIDIGFDIENDHEGSNNVIVDTGVGNDIVDVRHVEGRHGSGIVTVNLGAGDDELNARGNIDDAVVNMGDGVDKLTSDNVQGGADIDMGDDTDTVTITRFISQDSSINLGSGNDIINLGYFDDGAGSLVDGGEGTDVLNLTGSNTEGSNDIAINNIEIIQFTGNNASYDLDWKDIMLSDGTNDDISEVYINQTGSNNQIDLDSGWVRDTNSTPPATDPLGENHSYYIYMKTKNDITETLYIDQTIDITI